MASASQGSFDVHHAAKAMTDATVAVMSYNLGIQNNELRGRNWDRKYRKLQDDVKSAFFHEKGIQVLLLCEFGEMGSPIEAMFFGGVQQPTGVTVYSTQEFFENLLTSIHLTHIHVVAHAPYVALIDSQCWRVQHEEVLQNICTCTKIIVQHLILEHVNTSQTLRCFNAHIPIKWGTTQRTQQCVLQMCSLATGIGVEQPNATMPWIIAGDLNVDQATMAGWCQGFINPDVPCFSKSEWPQHANVQKANHALSQGIALVPIQSWVGFHNKPCASDVHDAVVVMGVLQTIDRKQTSAKARLEQCIWHLIRVATVIPGYACSYVMQAARDVCSYVC